MQRQWAYIVDIHGRIKWNQIIFKHQTPARVESKVNDNADGDDGTRCEPVICSYWQIIIDEM